MAHAHAPPHCNPPSPGSPARSVEPRAVVAVNASAGLYVSSTSRSFNVSWMVSAYPDLSGPFKMGVFTTDASRDYTVKVRVQTRSGSRLRKRVVGEGG